MTNKEQLQKHIDTIRAILNEEPRDLTLIQALIRFLPGQEVDWYERVEEILWRVNWEMGAADIYGDFDELDLSDICLMIQKMLQFHIITKEMSDDEIKEKIVAFMNKVYFPGVCEDYDAALARFAKGGK